MDGAGPPLVGTTTLTGEDSAVLMKAGRSRLGGFTQPRMLLYSAVEAMLSAWFAMTGYALASVALLSLAVVFLILALVAGARTTRVYAAQYTRGGQREIELNDDGVNVREPGMTVSYAWSRFDRAFETGAHFALTAGPAVVIVPKRAFAADATGRVRELIGAKLPLQPLR